MFSFLGSGEFFASKPLFQFCQTLSKEEFPRLKLNIMTNGTLFNRYKWEKLSNIKGMVNKVHVSIDAANKETYEKLRRGGKWEVLCDNMEFVSSLRVSDEIKEFVMSFVVQKENFRQMRDYVILAKKWNVDRVEFRRLKNITYSHDIYIDNDVFNKENTHYKEAIEILSDINKEEKEIVISDNCIEPNRSYKKYNRSSPNGRYIGEITKDVVIKQTFLSNNNNLCAIQIMFATFARANSSSVNLQLYDENDVLINEETIQCETMIDNSYLRYKFADINDSLGKKYTLVISSKDASPGNAVTIWCANGDSYEGNLFINDQRQIDNLCILLKYSKQ